MKIFLVAAVLFSAATSAGAQTAMTDQQFAYNFGVSSSFEIRSSKELVSVDVGCPALTAFAETMITDHSRLNARLRATLDSHAVNAPGRLDGHHQSLLDQLRRSDRPAATYVTQQRQAHVEAIDLVTQYVENTEPDGPLKQFATAALPTLKAHLAQLEDMTPCT